MPMPQVLLHGHDHGQDDVAVDVVPDGSLRGGGDDVPTNSRSSGADGSRCSSSSRTTSSVDSPTISSIRVTDDIPIHSSTASRRGRR